ncbi:centromere protein X-like protein [Fennellomyces sp. T-0311]|nr:centromere protein X-like protein [Fennellomyces sp. T-0311]
MADEDRETFKPETINAIFKQSWKESNTRANKEAQLLACEFLRLFVTGKFCEAVHRAADTVTEDDQHIDAEHFEQTLNQLLLDF